MYIPNVYPFNLKRKIYVDESPIIINDKSFTDLESLSKHDSYTKNSYKTKESDESDESNENNSSEQANSSDTKILLVKKSSNTSLLKYNAIRFLICMVIVLIVICLCIYL